MQNQSVLNGQLKNNNRIHWKSRSNIKNYFCVEGVRVVAVPPLRSQDSPLSVRVFQVSWGLAEAPGLATKWPSQAVNAAPQICPGDFPKKVLNQEFAEVFWPTRQTLCQSFLCWLDYSCHEWESVQAESSIHARSSKRCVNLGSRTLNSSESPICITSFETIKGRKYFVLCNLHFYRMRSCVALSLPLSLPPPPPLTHSLSLSPCLPRLWLFPECRARAEVGGSHLRGAGENLLDSNTEGKRVRKTNWVEVSRNPK